jgi:hypothetical protein
MNKILLIIVLVMFGHPVYAEDVIDIRLEEIYKQYQATKQDRSEEEIKLLISLDRELRKLIDKSWTVQNKAIDAKYWKKKYVDIGVTVGNYSDALGYSGKLLIEAKALDTNSKYASHTRYADVCKGRGSFSGACYVPNMGASLKYEKEFPDGPFLWDTLVTIGNLYSDLSEALKAGEKHECFSKYMSNEQASIQMESARTLAIKYYEKALALHTDDKSANESIQEWLTELITKGDNIGWHYCAD